MPLRTLCRGYAAVDDLAQGGVEKRCAYARCAVGPSRLRLQSDRPTLSQCPYAIRGHFVREVQRAGDRLAGELDPDYARSPQDISIIVRESVEHQHNDILQTVGDGFVQSRRRHGEHPPVRVLLERTVGHQTVDRARHQ